MAAEAIAMLNFIWWIRRKISRKKDNKDFALEDFTKQIQRELEGEEDVEENEDKKITQKVDTLLALIFSFKKFKTTSIEMVQQ